MSEYNIEPMDLDLMDYLNLPEEIFNNDGNMNINKPNNI